MSHTPDDDDALESLVRESTATGIARNALLLRLSTLPRGLSQPHHLRLAQEAVTPLTLADHGRCFRLPNTDLALVWRGDTPSLPRALAALRHLFADALPPPDLAALAEPMQLPAQADRLLAAIDEARRPRQPPPAPPPAPGRTLDLPTLAALETALARADLARFARRQPVCTATAHGFALAWEHRQLCLPELADTLAPGHDLAAAPWLLRRLTRTLDRRLLALLAAPGELHPTTPFGLDLLVDSLLSPDFLRFDATLPPSLRGQVTIGLHPADILADPASFRFARDFARTRQYRLLLRGLTADLLPVLPRARLGLDLIELPCRIPPEEPTHTLLVPTDDSTALAWGRAHGIGFFSVAPTTRKARVLF